MAYSSRPAVSMSHPDRWLAFLRVVVGLYFAKAVITKLGVVMVGGVIPLPGANERWINVMPTIVTKQASENPILFYKHFLENTVLAHGELFAHLTALGEAIAGVGLTLGLLSGAAALTGLVLVTNYGLATQWMSPGQQGFHVVLVALMIAFFVSRSGRTWGLDARLWSDRPKSIFARRPFS
ncbi:MAG: DoxX family membrane protein [Gemmatimonadota bacterium]|nr:DoxX family membrane protein [Gemmatimonadota bacterium]